MGEEVQVWSVRTGSLSDAEVAFAHELLSDDERERGQRLRSATHRRDFAIKRALVRLALSRCANVDARAWTFGTVDNGRPCIVSPAAGDLDFSVSDTRGLVALLISRGVRAAIDVEHLDPRMKIEPMARRFFSPPEQEAVFRLDEGRRPRRFFELWTAKEAFVKALGTGFAHGFREFTICVDPLRAGDGWHLERLDFGDDYAATVAIRGDRRRIVMEDGRALFSR